MKTLLSLLFCVLAGLTQASDAPSPRAQLESFLDGLNTLQADFEQLLTDAETGEVRRASGVLYVLRPGRFRWQYEGEYPRYIVADGRTIWLVETDLEQVSQRSQQAALKGTPAGLLAEQIDLDRDFTVRELGVRRGVAWLKLIPRDEQSQFEQILLGLEDGKLVRLEMADRFGQVTDLRFHEVQRNPPLDEDLFRFEPPPGYDILDQ